MRVQTIPLVLAASLALLAVAPGCRGKRFGGASKDAEGAADGGAAEVATYRSVPLSEVRAGSLADGAAVEVDAVILPTTIVSTSSESQLGPKSSSYFMLAVPADAAYLKTLAGIRDDVAKLGADVAKIKPGKAPANLDALLEQQTALAKRLEEAKVVPSEAIAVELGGFDEGKMRLTWDKTIKECTGVYCMPEIPTMPSIDFSKIKLDECAFASGAKRDECIAAAEQRIDQLAALDPPSLDDPLPKLPSMALVDDQAAVRRFNKLVPRFNKEVDRRNTAVAAGLSWKVDRIGRVASAMMGAPWKVRGIVGQVSGMAARVYRETMGSAPPRAVVESMAVGSPRFTAQTYAKTRYCFASRPSGADILIGGTSAGHTPACVDTLRPGEDADIQLQLPGRTPAKVEPAKVRASTGNLTELDCVLAKQGSAGQSVCRITY